MTLDKIKNCYWENFVVVHEQFLVIIWWKVNLGKFKILTKSKTKKSSSVMKKGLIGDVLKKKTMMMMKTFPGEM